MAAAQHSRTRSDRVGQATRRPLSIHGKLPQQPSQLQSQSQAQPPSTPSAPASNGAVPSFLTNLRLLDLDRLPDWPDISPATFAITGTGVQGQKKRVQAVEWALFRLFEIWDPEEAASVRTDTL